MRRKVTAYQLFMKLNECSPGLGSYPWTDETPLAKAPSGSGCQALAKGGWAAGLSAPAVRCASVLHTR